MKLNTRLIAAAAALALAGPALADITIGVVAPLTGPASGLGIPVGNQVKLWPSSIAGEKLKVIVLDDATDPTNGTKIAKRFVTEDKVDVIMGSVATPVAIPVAAPETLPTAVPEAAPQEVAPSPQESVAAPESAAPMITTLPAPITAP